MDIYCPLTQLAHATDGVSHNDPTGLSPFLRGFTWTLSQMAWCNLERRNDALRELHSHLFRCVQKGPIRNDEARAIVNRVVTALLPLATAHEVTWPETTTAPQMAEDIRRYAEKRDMWVSMDAASAASSILIIATGIQVDRLAVGRQLGNFVIDTAAAWCTILGDEQDDTPAEAAIKAVAQ